MVPDSADGEARVSVGLHYVKCAGTCGRLFYCPEDVESDNFCPLCQTTTSVEGPTEEKKEGPPADGGTEAG